MSQETLERKVCVIIAEQLGISDEEIHRELTFVDDLGADSLDIVELVMALEEEFSVEIPDEDAESMRSVGDLVDYLDARQVS